MSYGTGMIVEGDGALRCSLSLSPNAMPVSPIYFSGQLICGHLYLYMTPLFCSLVSLSLSAMSRVLIVFEPLKCTCIPFLLHVLLLFTQSLYVWNHHETVPVVAIAVIGPICVVVAVMVVC